MAPNSLPPLESCPPPATPRRRDCVTLLHKSSVANKRWKICFLCLLTRKMQIKNSVRYLYKTHKIAKIKKMQNAKYRWVWREPETLRPRWWEDEMLPPLWKIVLQYLGKLSICPSCDPAIMPSSVSSQQKCVFIYTRSQMFPTIHSLQPETRNLLNSHPHYAG